MNFSLKNYLTDDRWLICLYFQANSEFIAEAIEIFSGRCYSMGRNQPLQMSSKTDTEGPFHKNRKTEILL